MLLGKEMKIGLLNGGLLGILALVLLGIYVHAFKGVCLGGSLCSIRMCRDFSCTGHDGVQHGGNRYTDVLS